MNALAEDIAKARILLSKAEPENLIALRNIERQLKSTQHEAHDLSTAEKDEIQHLITALSQQRKKLESQAQHEAAQNLKRKHDLIAKIIDLVKLSDTIGTAMRMLTEIQTQWKSIGPVPSAHQKDIQAEYQKALDGFYYNLKIFKALQSHDLKKNETLKNELIVKLEQLVNSDNIREIERLLRVYRNTWEELGPVEQAHWEDLKARYHNAHQQVQNQLKTLYALKKDETEHNYNLKKALLTQAETLYSGLHDTSKLSQWNEVSQQLLNLQEAWKNIGYSGALTEHEDIWKSFKSLLNTFYSAKKTKFKAIKSLHEESRTQKKALIERAEQLKNDTSWERTTQQFIELQKQWKSIPGHGDRLEQKLYKNFRKHCDAFFEFKKASHQAAVQKEQATQHAFEALIEELSKLTEASNLNPSQIDTYRNQWKAVVSETGVQPEKTLSQSFFQQLERLYGYTTLTALDKTRVLYALKLEKLEHHTNIQEAFRKEKSYLQKTIQDIERQIHTYENNLGFVKSSKTENPLFTNIRNQLDNEKRKLEQMHLKWTIFKEFIKSKPAILK